MKHTRLTKEVVAKVVISPSRTTLPCHSKSADYRKVDLIAEFLLNNYPNEHTQKGIVADLRQFAAWLSKTFGKDVFEVTAPELGLFRRHLEALGYKIGSINRKLSSLKAFYRYLHEVGVNDTNVAQYLKLIKTGHRSEQLLRFNRRSYGSYLNLLTIRSRMICVTR